MPPTRRDFLTASGLTLLGIARHTREAAGAPQVPEPIIDIHQHVHYSGRPDNVLLAHQRAMGATMTILLPAGRSVSRPSTHHGVANGLQADAFGNGACLQFARAHGAEYRFAANEVPDEDGATAEIERYLALGGLLIGEQKFGVECDSPEMRRLYDIARHHGVPVLMHWQHQMYNHGFERFHRVLEQYPAVTFIGHAQTWWANIDADNRDQTVMYPKGPVAPGGLTDRYLRDYANMFGDLSAGSGLNAMTRDEAFTRDFLTRHQDKLLYGSDCSDHDGRGATCSGAQAIAAIRRLAANRDVERKLLYGNATRLFRL